MVDAATCRASSSPSGSAQKRMPARCGRTARRPPLASIDLLDIPRREGADGTMSASRAASSIDRRPEAASRRGTRAAGRVQRGALIE